MQRKLVDSIPLVTEKFFSLPAEETDNHYEIPFPLPDSQDTLLAFIATEDGEQFSHGTGQLLENIKQWLIKHNADSASLTSNIDDFARRFTAESIHSGINLKARFQLCTKSIRNLNSIYCSIQSDVHSISNRIVILTDLIQKLSNCDDGVCSYIKDTQQLLSSNPAIQLQSIKVYLAQQAAQKLLLLYIRNGQISPGNEIHYVNALLNLVHEELGIEIIEDSLMPSEEYSLNIKDLFRKMLAQFLGPAKIISSIINRIDLPLIIENLNKNFVKGRKQLEQALNMYGEDAYFSFKQLLDEAAFEEDGAIKLSNDARDYIFISLFERLKNSGCFRSQCTLKFTRDNIAFYAIKEHPFIYSFIITSGEAGYPQRIPFAALTKKAELLHAVETFINHSLNRFYDKRQLYAALFSLMGKQHIAAFKMYFEKFVESNPLKIEQFLPLIRSAVRNSHLEAIEFIFSHYLQFDPVEHTPAGGTSLHWLIRNKHIDMLKLFIAHPATSINPLDQYRDTPLHLAVKLIQIDAVHALLAHKDILVNYVDRDANSSLHLAIVKDSAELVSALLSREDIDVHLKNAENETPLHIALQQSSSEIFKLLLDDSKINPNVQESKNLATVLHWAVTDGRDDLVELLLAHPGIKFDVFDKRGDYPIHLAVYEGNKKILALLLEDNRIDLNVKNAKGLRPLECISPNNNPDLYNWMVKHYPQYYSASHALHGLFASKPKRERDEDDKGPASKKPRLD